MPTIDLSKAVAQILKEYGEDVKDATGRALIEMKQQGVQIMRANSPVSKKSKKPGKYRAGWVATDVQVGYGQVNLVFYNKTDWQLTHLLNNGFYSVRKGERIEGDGHIDNAEKEMNEYFIKKMEENL